MVFAPVAEQIARSEYLLAVIGLDGEILRRSGTARLHGRQYWDMAMLYLEEAQLPLELDVDLEWTGTEHPPQFVSRQAVTRVAGLPSLGPGGRVTQFELPSGEFIDIAVRPLVSLAESGGWRDPDEVEGAVRAMVGPLPEYRLRAAFGYPEPSAYEAADVVGAAFVFVLDGPRSGEGPAWRVSIAVPADRTSPAEDWDV
jgi:hypothetical protein